MEVAYGKIPEEQTNEPVEEMTEDKFLKDLYLFMKKRDTPIERIPHLGFKQIDLFVMFKTVNDLGGYHQVTSQQLWKQVYNTLGGNPRSTSAATCTRRHYEKLLLPYECHVKGIILTAMPHHQPKPYHYASSSKDNDCGERPAKRKMLSIPLHQSPHDLQSGPRGSLFPLPLHYPHYYHPSHAVLPPYVPMPSSLLTPQVSPAPKPQFPVPPPPLHSTDRAKEPLEHLRYLAEQYKTSSGLAEPLNLSVKASIRETNTNPISSFTPPSASKNPKFLNKPSTLYSPNHAGTLRNEECETQDEESHNGVTPFLYPVKAREAPVVDAITSSGSPRYGSTPTLGTDRDAIATAQKPSSPKTDFTIRPKDDREASPEVRGLNLSHLLPSLPQEKDGKMEIEIPLSVFHNWLKLYKSSAMMHEAEEPPLPPQEQHSGQRNWSSTEILPTHLSFHMNPQHQSSAEDLRPRNVPSPIPTTQETGNHHTTRQNGVISNKLLPSDGILQSAASHDICTFDQRSITMLYNSASPNFWDACDKETQATPIQMKTDSSPIRVQQDFASKLHTEGTVQGGMQKPQMGSSALLMVNSSNASLLQLTTEEVMKLKKIISSSS